jgi:hypothetical protein
LWRDMFRLAYLVRKGEMFDVLKMQAVSLSSNTWTSDE